MRGRAELVRGWLLKAESDLTASEASHRAGALDAACFHAQQAAEKVLKAFLTHNVAGFPPTHNLAKLVRLCEQVDESFSELICVVEPLTPYVVELRYDVGFWPSEEVARDTRAAVEAVRDAVLAKLPEKITKGIA